MLNLKEGEYLGNKLKANENSFCNLSITSYDPDKVIEKHCHANNYISVLTSGNYVDYSNNCDLPVMVGDILFRPSCYMHQNVFLKSGGKCFNIEFKPEWQKKLDINLPLPANFVHFKAGVFPSLYKLLVNFQSGYNYDSALEHICDWLFEINQKSAIRGSQLWVEKVEHILDNELDHFHTLHSLSDRVFVHPVYLARAFKQRKGVTIGEYQLKAKLSHALNLLLITSYSISDIAFQNGFYDDAHFIHSFSSVYNMSPQKFRALVKS